MPSLPRLLKRLSFRVATAYLAAGCAWLYLPADPLWRLFGAVGPLTPEAAKWLPFFGLSALAFHVILKWQTGRISRINGYARRMQYFVRGLIEHCPMPFIVKDEKGVVVFANRPASQRHSLEADAMDGKTIQDLFPPDIAQRIAANDRLVMETGTAVEEDFEFSLDGQLISSRVVKFPIVDDRATVKGTGTFAIDLTYSRFIEGKLQQRLSLDDFTGLPNRDFITREIPQLIERARENDQELTLLLVAFDGLRKIEAALGHEIADQALMIAIDRLKGAVGPDATLAYMRGWDILVVYRQLPGLRGSSNLARTITDVFSAPIALAENQIFASPRIGLSTYPKDGEMAETLLRNVRMALEDAVAEPTGSFTQCLPGSERIAHRRLAIETQLRTALERGEFSLAYQPQLDAKTEQIIGAEALIRWRNPTLGVVSPAEFIPIAEETGLITAIDRWVLETACREAMTWGGVGGEHIRVAVNVTAHQFTSQEFICHVSKVLRETGLSARRLEIELTERVFLKGGAAVKENLEWLSKLNVHLAIDDFGTGYSSLKTLKAFPFDVLKIDKSFVDDVGRQGGDLTIIQSIVGMGKKLGHCVVAEGIETDQQRKILRTLGVDVMQGYFYSRPISGFEFRQFVRRRKPSRTVVPTTMPA